MARVGSTTSAGTPVGPMGGMTLDALMARAKAAADRQAEIAAPRQMTSPWQGAAQLAQSFVNARQGAYAEDQAQQGRAQLAQLLSGVNPETGADPATAAQIYSLDPEAGARVMEAAAAAIRAKREREQHLADLADERRYQEGQTAATRTYEDTREQRIDTRELGQAQDATAAEQARKDAEHERAVKEGRVAHVTGQEAKDLGLDPTRLYEYNPTSRTVKDITHDAPEAWRAPTAQEIKDYNLNPNLPYRVSTTTGKPEAVGGQPVITGQDRKALWGQQDEYINSSAAIGQLTRARDLLDQGINTGYTAGARTMYGAAGGPGGDPEAASRTKEYNSIMNTEAIAAMSQALKGSTTDTEMAEFIKNMNDPTLDPGVKARQIDRMLAKAAAFNEQQGLRIKELGGDVPAKPGAVKVGPEEEQTLLQQARDAIAKGADAALVKKRLAEKGVDAGKL